MKIASTIILYFIINTVSFGQNKKCIDDHNAGVKAYNKKDYSSALYYFKKAADNCGMNESYNALGRMYYYGHGVEKDDCEAMKWFNKASRLDDKSSAVVSLIKEFNNGDPCDKSKSKPTERLYNNPFTGTKATTNTTRKSNQTVQLERGTYVGETINGKPDGKGVLTQKDGQVISGEFKNGIEHGRCLNCLKDGCFSANYNEGKIHDGAYWFTDKTGEKIIEKGNIVNGEKHGEIRYFNPKSNSSSGGLLTIANWEKGKFVNYKEGYDLYGNVIFRNGTGKIIEVNDEGLIMLETNYVNHCQSGVQTYYYNSGKKYLVIVWKCSENSLGESLLWEAVARYDEKGNPLPKGTLKNGNGTFIFFDYEKRKTFEETYNNGKKISQRELK